MGTRTCASMLERLHRKQQRRSSLLAKVEKTAAQLERRRDRLDALEATIARLESQLAETGSLAGKARSMVHRMRQARLIYNPSSGPDTNHNGARLSHIVVSLRRHGVATTIELKTSGSAARALARDAVREDAQMVIVAAGDGTIAEVAAQLIGTATVLGIVPIGTMNNIARSLGIPLDIEAACALIGMGTTRHIDAGRVRGKDGASAEYFLESSGTGLTKLGTLAGQAFEKRRWRLLPRALQRFLGAPLARVQVELDGTRFEASTRLVTVCNAPLLGNNLLAAPGAKMDDGLLDVSLYDSMGDGALAAHILLAARHETDATPIHRAKHVRITAQAEPAADGPAGAEHALQVIEIDAVPAALAVIVGNGIGLTMPVGSAPNAPTYALPPPAPNGSENALSLNGATGSNGHVHQEPAHTHA